MATTKRRIIFAAEDDWVKHIGVEAIKRGIRPGKLILAALREMIGEPPPYSQANYPKPRRRVRTAA